MQAHWRMRRKPGTFCWIAPPSPLLWPSWGELLTECVLHIIFLNRKVNFPPAHRNKYWASHFLKISIPRGDRILACLRAPVSRVPTPASTLMGSFFQNSAVPPSSLFILNNPPLKRLRMAVSKMLPLALALFSALLPAPISLSEYLFWCISVPQQVILLLLMRLYTRHQQC